MVMTADRECGLRRSLLSSLATVVLAVLLGCASSGPPPPSSPSPLLGQPLPGLRGLTLSGERIAPESLQDRVVVIKFFAKYCEPCTRTLPAAQRIHQRRGEVLFIGVSEDERASEAEEIARLYGLTFPVVHDRSNVLAGKFRVNELPVTFVSDRRGKIHHVLGPEQGEDALERVLDSLQ